MTPRETQQRRTQQREQGEPEELKNPTPLALVLLAIVMTCWGVWYYFANAGYPMAAGDRRTPVETPTLDQLDGAQVYAANCVACHQTDGQGLAGVFPPLVGSRWVLESRERLVQIMLYGIQGPIEVRGKVYNGAMPAFARLSDAELAAVTSHIRSTWGNAAAQLAPEEFTSGRDRFPGRSASWAGGEELDAVLGAD